MIADRSAHRASLEAYFIQAFGRQKSIGEKKLLQKFGGLKNLSYLCTNNPQEKAVRSSLVEGVLSWSSKRGASLTGFIEAIFDIFHN